MRIFSLAILLLLLSVSCDNDRSAIIPVIYPTAPTENLQLERIEYRPGGGWTDISYDAIGRISETNAWEGDYTSRTEYHYNGAGLLQQTDYFIGFGSDLELSSSRIYFYGTTGRLDSVQTQRFTEGVLRFTTAKVYTYINDQTFSGTSYRNTEGELIPRQLFEWENGNISRIIHFENNGIDIRLDTGPIVYDDAVNVNRTVFPYAGEHPYIVSLNNRQAANLSYFYNDYVTVDSVARDGDVWTRYFFEN